MVPPGQRLLFLDAPSCSGKTETPGGTGTLHGLCINLRACVVHLHGSCAIKGVCERTSSLTERQRLKVCHRLPPIFAQLHQAGFSFLFPLPHKMLPAVGADAPGKHINRKG